MSSLLNVLLYGLLFPLCVGFAISFAFFWLAAPYSSLIVIAGVCATWYAFRNKILDAIVEETSSKGGIESGGFAWLEPADNIPRLGFSCLSCHFPHREASCPKCGSRLKKVI